MARERVAPPPPDPPDTSSRSRPVNQKVAVAKKVTKVRRKKRPTLCTKSSERSLSKSLSKSKTSEKDSVVIANLKRNNTMLAKYVNQLKQLVATKESEIMSYKNEIMALNQENSILRSELDKHDSEENSYIASQKGVKACLDAAIDSFVTFTADFNKEMEKAYSEVNRGLKAARLSRQSRSRSTGKALMDPSRESSQLLKPPSPVKNLPQSKVSPMVAGHPITRPRVQLTRMTLPDQAHQEIQEDANQEVIELGREVEEQVPSFQEPNPETPRRTIFDITVIREESDVEETTPERPGRAVDPLAIQSDDDTTNFGEDAGDDVDSQSVIVDNDEEEREDSAPDIETEETDSVISLPVPSSQEDTSLMASGSPVQVNGLEDFRSPESEHDVSIRRRYSNTRNRRSRPIISGFYRNSGPGSAIDKENVVSNNEDLHDKLSTSVLLRCSPQVDILKSRRYPEVRLSNVANQANISHRGDSRSSLSLDKSPAKSAGQDRTGSVMAATGRKSAEEGTNQKAGNRQQQLDLAVLDLSAPSEVSSGASSPRCDNKSVSFLDSLNYDPMEGPSWLFESLKKKKKRNSRGSRKKRKSASSKRLSSPVFIDSPSENDLSPEVDLDTSHTRSRGSIDTNKFLSTLNSRKNSLSPGDMNTSTTLTLPVDETIGTLDFTKFARRLSLEDSLRAYTPVCDSSGGGEAVQQVTPKRGEVQHEPGSRTPLREIRLESLGQVLTYNPRVDSGALVKDLREARIYLKNTKSCGDDPNESNLAKLSNSYLSPGKESRLSRESIMDVGVHSLSVFNGEQVFIRTPRVDVNKSEVRLSQGSPLSGYIRRSTSLQNRSEAQKFAAALDLTEHVDEASTQQDNCEDDLSEMNLSDRIKRRTSRKARKTIQENLTEENVNTSKENGVKEVDDEDEIQVIEVSVAKPDKRQSSLTGRGKKRGSTHLDEDDEVGKLVGKSPSGVGGWRQQQQQLADKEEEEEEESNASDDNFSEANFEVGQTADMVNGVGDDDTEDSKRPSRRRNTSKTSYTEPSLRKKMRQGDPGSSSADPNFVPQIKKKLKKK